MSPQLIFNLQLALGYVAWALCTAAYILPKLRAMDHVAAQRAIATLHSFRVFGLVFILPGVVGNLPVGFGPFAAYGDFATGLLAILALLAIRIRPLFWLSVVAFNVAGAVDILVDYYHGVVLNLPLRAGELGSTYGIVIIYVPVLMITHGISFYLMMRSQARTDPTMTRKMAASSAIR